MNSTPFQAFLTNAIAVFLEGAPFLFLGALLSSLIEVLVPPEWIAKHAPKGRFSGIGVGVIGGLFLPTCECGIVPITRRLILKGVPLHTSVSYMIAAPVINPVVLLSTFMAFKGDYTHVLGRVFMVAIPSIMLGMIFTGKKKEDVLRERVLKSHSHSTENDDHHHDEEDHHHGEDACPASHQPGGIGKKLFKVLRFAGFEFLDMGQYLLAGAFASALFKVYASAEILEPFETNIWFSVGAMMVLSIVLSICSEADAFVAAAFSTFPAAAKIAFVAVGGMVDLKLIPMFFSVFRFRPAMIVNLLPFIVVYFLATLGSGLFG